MISSAQRVRERCPSFVVKRSEENLRESVTDIYSVSRIAQPFGSGVMCPETRNPSEAAFVCPETRNPSEAALCVPKRLYFTL